MREVGFGLTLLSYCSVDLIVEKMKADMITISTGDFMKLILKRPVQFVVVEVPQVPFRPKVYEPEHIFEEPAKVEKVEKTEEVGQDKEVGKGGNAESRGRGVFDNELEAKLAMMLLFTEQQCVELEKNVVETASKIADMVPRTQNVDKDNIEVAKGTRKNVNLDTLALIDVIDAVRVFLCDKDCSAILLSSWAFFDVDLDHSSDLDDHSCGQCILPCNAPGCEDMVDPIDEYAMRQLRGLEEKRLKSITQEGLDIEDGDGKKVFEHSSEEENDFDDYNYDAPTAEEMAFWAAESWRHCESASVGM